MDIETAQGLVASAPPSVSEMRQKLAEHHSAEPQRAMLADHAMLEVEVALERLAALGHRFWLSSAPMAAGSEFPKMIYRDTSSGVEEKVVENQAEQDEALHDGWRLTPSSLEEQVEPEPPPEPEPEPEPEPAPTVKV